MFDFITKRLRKKQEHEPVKDMSDANQVLFKQSLEKVPRSSKWQSVRLEFLKENGYECACCKSKNNLNVHHKKPFHLYPELELDKNNLIILCENKVLNCHYVIGHCFDWVAYNPMCEIDASKIKMSIEDRLYK